MYWSKTSTERAPRIGLGRGHSGETVRIGVEASNMCTCLMLLPQSGLFLGYALGQLIVYERVLLMFYHILLKL